MTIHTYDLHEFDAECVRVKVAQEEVVLLHFEFAGPPD
jgi:hypothetical protein